MTKPALAFPLVTERLELRPHRAEDARALREIYGRDEVARYLLENPWDAEYAKRQVAERLAKTGLDTEAEALSLVVEREGRIIGVVELWMEGGDELAEIGWVFSPEAGGKGYATEAVATLLDLGFDHYGLHRVVAQMDGRNEAAARLAERLGMIREGYLRSNWFSKGEWTDTIIYAMLASDR